MGLLGSLFSAAADIAKETITETMNQNETEKFIKIMMERDAQNAEANEKLYQDWLTHERSNYFAAKKNTILLACMIKEKKYGRHQYLNSKSQFR